MKSRISDEYGPVGRTWKLVALLALEPWQLPLDTWEARNSRIDPGPQETAPLERPEA